MFQPYKLYVAVLDLAAAVPDVHDKEKSAACHQGNKTTVREFFEVGEQEAKFYGEVNDQEQVDPYRFGPPRNQEVGKQDGSGNHTNGDSQTIGRLHIGSFFKV